MRRRATYVTHPSRAVNPDDIQVRPKQLLLGALKAAREERLTYGLEELPPELADYLRQCHELHMRWAPETLYNTTAPFFSRISPGLHVQYTPLNETQPDRLCNLVHRLFGKQLKCESPHATFISPPLVSERFAQTSSLQYYSHLPSLKHLVAYIYHTSCAQNDLLCVHTIALLNFADSVDADYDSISHTLTFTAFWSKQPPVFYDPIGDLTTLDAWNLDVEAKRDDRVEVGILSAGKANDPSDLQLSGFLTVVGEDDRPKATLFSFPSRHHCLTSEQSAAQKFTVSFDQPTGLHPTLRMSFPSASSLAEPTNKPAGSVCALQTYLTLPSHIFADKYAFLSNDPLFQNSHHLGELHSIAGETDLEAPDYVVKKWGSTMLLGIQTPNNTVSTAKSNHASWDVTIPLHLRYLEPNNKGTSEVDVPWPVVFWACTAEDGTKFPVNPFDRTQLGYEGLFGPRTMFYHLDPAPVNRPSDKLVERISVPVLNLEAASSSTIEILTVVTIALGFLWVLLRLKPAFWPQSPGDAQASGLKKRQ
ncbi:protease B nonderepressible form [Cladophialophora chaetospira]|uniref:Protein PBN1 n=1 Tax=Cladophialophora chaetospira TaxID=386627 RepID=A0AA39CKE9_9EURO|nr:protease B nonderepressible form [Cladophialophora chaetospira]